jgi:hypothetical protein
LGFPDDDASNGMQPGQRPSPRNKRSNTIAETISKKKKKTASKYNGRFGPDFSAMVSSSKKCHIFQLNNPLANYQVQNMAWQHLPFLREHFDLDGEDGVVKPWADGDFHALHDHSRLQARSGQATFHGLWVLPGVHGSHQFCC